MSRRAIPALVVVIAALIGLVVVGRGALRPSERRCTGNIDPSACTSSFFAATGDTWMPALGVSGELTGTWFCPGVPTSGEEGVGGEVVVSNREPTQISGRFQILTEAGVVAEEPFAVDAWSQLPIDVDQRAQGATFASVVVEIEGGAGFVEQLAQHPLGDSAAACSNDTSPNWYVADGFTVEGSIETLILTNPFDEAVVADLRFSTEARESEPGQFKGFTVLPRSVRMIPIAELGARDEPVISVAVEATAGRLVVGRSQEYRGGGRSGYSLSLAAPSLDDQWWFADGERSAGVTETYSIYNPTDDAVEVTVFLGGLPLTASAVNDNRDAIVVPSRRVVVFDPFAIGPAEEDLVETGDQAPPTSDIVDDAAQDAEVPEGRHSAVFSTLAQPSIVVERILTRPIDDTVSTTAVLGALPVPDTGFVPNTWNLGIGPCEPTEQALVVYNIDQVEASVSVSAVGPNGPEVVPSLSELALASGGILTIDLTDPEVLGRELIVTSTSRVFVERLLPRGEGLPGRSGSWLLPSSG
jgi:Family of unknown function (DUF5719)